MFLSLEFVLILLLLVFFHTVKSIFSISSWYVFDVFFMERNILVTDTLLSIRLIIINYLFNLFIIKNRNLPSQQEK